MTCRIRAARPSDVRAFYDLAKLTGGGFTNLPAEKATLEAKLARSEQGFSREGEVPSDDLYVFMLAVPEIGVEPTRALSLSLLAYGGSLFWSVIGGIVYVCRRDRDRLTEIARPAEMTEEMTGK